MMVGMNAHQNRALWASALRDLGNAIDLGACQPPDNLTVRTHGLSPADLLEAADTTAPRPLKIHVGQHSAYINIPTGERLGLDITWVLHAEWPLASAEDTASWTQAYEDHNAPGVPIDMAPTDVTAYGENPPAVATVDFTRVVSEGDL